MAYRTDVTESLFRPGRSPRLSAANVGGLWLEPRELDEGRPLRAVWANSSTVSLPNDKMRRLVAERFAPVTSVKASDNQVELYEAVVDQQSGEGSRQARVEPKSKLRHTRVFPPERQ
jgi:hypothetical protein